MLRVGCWLVAVARCLLSVNGCLSFVGYCLLVVVCWLLFVVWLLLVVWVWLVAVRRSSFVACCFVGWWVLIVD